MDYRGKFMVKPGEEVKLSKIDPDETFKTDKDAETLELTAKYTKELTELQNHLYAENRHSLLIVLQGMAASRSRARLNWNWRTTSCGGFTARRRAKEKS
ncbi:hypothetical protein [Victivallis vadensis]|uniref:hypothetical protein n=1 Tax=Victivallis vadensis TaxID=172901 RepID=UPI00266BAB84|nr:hypothetical protein [Victivallis vadensis]